MTPNEFNALFGDVDAEMELRVPPKDSAEDTPGNRWTAAERYLTWDMYNKWIDTLVHQQAMAIADHRRPEFFRVIREAWPSDLRYTYLQSLSTRFTVRQLELLATDEGRAVFMAGNVMVGPGKPSEGREDSPEDRRVAAQHFHATVDIRRAYAIRTRALARHVGAQNQEVLFGVAASRYEEIRRNDLDRLTKYVSRSDIDLMRHFYGSSEGRQIYLREQLVIADMAPSLIRMNQRIEEVLRTRK